MLHDQRSRSAGRETRSRASASRRCGWRFEHGELVETRELPSEKAMFAAAVNAAVGSGMSLRAIDFEVDYALAERGRA